MADTTSCHRTVVSSKHTPAAANDAATHLGRAIRAAAKKPAALPKLRTSKARSAAVTSAVSTKRHGVRRELTIAASPRVGARR